MTRRYGDPTADALDVRRAEAGSDPAQFLWRGRLYVVRGVLAHWVEVGAWWRARLPDGLPVRVDDASREVWRVEAGAGRSSGSGVYDLEYDEGAGSWTLARALD